MGNPNVTPPVYVCVYVPEFSAQSMLRLRPEIAGSAVAVVQGHPPLEHVASMNTLGRRLGVEHGMTRAELDSFPGVVVLKRTHAEEEAARKVIQQAAGAFTPRAQLHQQTSTALVMVMDMTGTSLLFGTIEACLEQVKQAMQDLRFSVRLCSSANIMTALSLAPAATAKPLVVPAGKEEAALGRFPLSILNLTSAQAETLSTWGLRTVSDFARLPERDVVARLGQAGMQLYRLARGRAESILVPDIEEFTLEERIEFDSIVESLDSLLFVMGPMLDQMILRAQCRSYAIASVTCVLHLDGGSAHSRTIEPALPLLDAKALLKLLHLDLQAHPPHAGVSAIHLQASPGDQSKIQMGLFSPQVPESTRLDVTLARIEALVGAGRAGRARLQDSHAPQAFVMERFVVPQHPTRPRPARAEGGVMLRRLRPPVRVGVCMTAAKLQRIEFNNCMYEVKQAHGPWRSSGNWWSPSPWSHEEWDVWASSRGDETMCCVLLHDLLRGEWKMAAVYD